MEKMNLSVSILIILLLLELFVVEGFYIKNRSDELKRNHHERIKRNSDLDDYSKFGDILNFWNKFKDKLNDGEIVASDDDDDDVDAEAVEEDKFNELELLKMIPKIIDNYRTNKLTNDEKLQLSKIYGNLWTIITEEAERKQNEEMNPLLKALFDSFYLTKDITNDIDHNTVMEVTKKPITRKTSLAISSLSGLNIGLPTSSGSSRKLLLNVNKSDHPSQRLLNVAAMLIHQAINSRRRSQQHDPSSTSSIDSSASSAGADTKNKRRPYKILLPTTGTSQKRKATLNLQLTDIPIQKITRTKRNVNIHFSGNDQNSIQNSRIDALLKIFNNKGPSGYLINSVFDDDDDTENIDIDYLNQNENDKDYSYDDDFYEDGEEIVHGENLNSGSNEAADDVGEEYGSFQDLMLLAERHRLRREMEEDSLKRRGINRNIFTATKN